jgi:hypothetical protein
MPPYFTEFLSVPMKWRETEAWPLPLETVEESEARLDEVEEMEYSSLATSIASKAVTSSSAF